MRDNINKWIEQTLISVQQKYFTNVNEKNRDILYLYRLLTIKYRTVYPLRGKSYNVNDDLKIFLEDKISFALTVVLEKATLDFDADEKWDGEFVEDKQFSTMNKSGMLKSALKMSKPNLTESYGM